MQLLSVVRTWRPFFFRIILPTIFTLSLCVIAIFVIILPAFEANMLASKREMIKELTSSAWSIVDKFADQEAEGKMTTEKAKEQALFYINFLRYGDEVRDYFWVTDLTPRMLKHPFRPDLNGKDLREYRDPEGKRIFVEFVNIALEKGEGYVHYLWEDKNDPEKMVPKLSYVKLFEPWGWVIGTGIYLEDVDREIGALTGWLIEVSLVITTVITLLLIVVTRESMKIEAERLEKTRHLQESREKYRQLVEASTEGVLMLLDEAIVYSNKLFRDLVGYSEMELAERKLKDMLVEFPHGEKEADPAVFTPGDDSSWQGEVKLIKNDGSYFDGFMTVSPMALGGRPGKVVTVKDLARQKKIEDELGRSRKQYQQLIENINVGVFRTTVGKDGQFVEANPASAAILGFDSLEQLLSTPVGELFLDPEERLVFLRKLSQEGSTKHHPIRVQRRNGRTATVSISAVLVRDETGEPIYCDGIVEDITESFRLGEEQKKLIDELQTALLFLNEPIRQAPADTLVTCLLTTPINIAAKLMNEEKTGAILVQADEESEFIGIVTDHDLRKRILAGDLSADTPVLQIMSAPLVWVSEEALMFEGLLAMIEHNIGHIAVKDMNGRVTRVIGAMQFLRNQKYPLAMMLRDIRQAQTPAQLFKVRERLPVLMRSSYASRPDSRTMTHIISAVAEAVMVKCISFAVAELGPPPCTYAFMSLGSVGREEQTLVTDQDNAIVYEDVPESEQKEVARYFLSMGERVCRWLDRAGYTLCEGEVMAMNPEWCQPLSVWQDYFKQWVSTSEPADLLETKIFFDFKGVGGDFGLVNKLRTRLHELIKAKPMFLFHLVHNCLQFKAPLGLFKTIVVESAGEHRQKFSIKKAMTPITDLARIYALKHNISQTNTFNRLTKLEVAGHLSASEHRELTMVYRYLLDLRFKHQLQALEEGREPDNHVNPKDLTALEQAVLREALSQINSFQTKMSFDFTGSA